MTANTSTATLRSPKLIEHEHDALSDLLQIAQNHDLIVEKARRVLRDTLVDVPDRKITADPLEVEIMLGDWESAIADLHATIARAAHERAVLYAPFNPHDDGSIVGLTGDELEAVLRPIFEESGIGDRFFRDRAAYLAMTEETER